MSLAASHGWQWQFDGIISAKSCSQLHGLLGFCFIPTVCKFCTTQYTYFCCPSRVHSSSHVCGKLKQVAGTEAQELGRYKFSSFSCNIPGQQTTLFMQTSRVCWPNILGVKNQDWVSREAPLFYGSRLELSPSLCSYSTGEHLAPKSHLTAREAG